MAISDRGPFWDELDHYAELLGGELRTGGVIYCPGPGRADDDRSLLVWFDNGLDARFAAASGVDDWELCHEYVRRVCGLTSSLFDQAAKEARAESRRFWAEGGEADRRYPCQPSTGWPENGTTPTAERARAIRQSRLR